jgi:hypothetical protein
MPSSFPTAIDNLSNPTASSATTNPSHASQHSDANDAVEQIETKLGTGASVPTTTGHVLTVTGAGATAYQAAAPTAADYLVGTAQAGLSAEIVVGTTPGGELGGTWASPTVDTTHSGSSHAATQAAAEATAASALTTHAALAHHASSTGSSFPAQPAYGNNVPFYRTDRGTWYYYDGTRWLTTQLYRHAIDDLFDPALSATSTHWVMAVPTDYNMWLVGYEGQVFVNGGGTALSGSHSWVATLAKADVSAAATTVGTLTLNSGANNFRTLTATIGAVVDRTTHFAFKETWTKTGTPGTLQPLTVITYRLIG